MPKSESNRVSTGLPAANLRLGWRTLLLAMEAQQEFARRAFALWHDLTEIPAPPDGTGQIAAFGTQSVELAVDSARRTLRYASGLTTAAIETQTNFNAQLQQAITEWQSECPHGATNPFGIPDFADQLRKLVTPPTA